MTRKKDRWGPKPTKRELQTNLLLRYQNPLMHIIVGEAGSSVDRLCKALIPFCNNKKTEELTDQLMKSVPDIENKCGTPEFMAAVCALFYGSVVRLTQEATITEREYAAKKSNENIL